MPGKVTIVGAGNVGATCAFALAVDGTPDELVLLDINYKKAKGDILDIEHGSAFLPYTEFKGTNNYKDVKNSDIVVITAGAAQKEGESRLDLLSKNRAILKSIIKEVKRYAPKTVLMVVTNPVDVLTYFAQKDSGFPRHRVFGTGTTLDSVRLQSAIAKQFKVNAHNVHAYILGEHGDSAFAAWSNARVSNVPIQAMPEYNKPKLEKAFEKTRSAANDIIKMKGSTSYGIAVCVTEIVRTVLDNNHEVFPVTSVLNGEYGLKDVALSTPCILGSRGTERELVVPLSADEKKALRQSAALLKRAIRSEERRSKKRQSMKSK